MWELVESFRSELFGAGCSLVVFFLCMLVRKLLTKQPKEVSPFVQEILKSLESPYWYLSPYSRNGIEKDGILLRYDPDLGEGDAMIYDSKNCRSGDYLLKPHEKELLTAAIRKKVDQVKNNKAEETQKTILATLAKGKQ